MAKTIAAPTPTIPSLIPPPRKAIRGFFGPYAFLSNFFKEPDGTFVEWEYQRAKCADFKDRKHFDTLMDKRTLTPMQAKAMGRKMKLRDEWDEKKVPIMEFYVRKKFRDHRDLALLLKMTGNAHLEETNTWGDRFWGVSSGQGLNILGDILMLVRDELPDF